jgi:small subunit ribosomal protein S1
MSESSSQRRNASQRPEQRVFKGLIVGISGDDVIVEIGPRMQGVLAPRDFPVPPEVGQTHEFHLRGTEDGLWLLALKNTIDLAAGLDVQVGSLVKAKVTGQNTGGLECKVGQTPAFLPASQVDVKREENLAQYIGQTITCVVTEADAAKKRVVLSRREALEKEQEVTRKESIGSLHTGQKVRGKVTRVESFGAFVALGGGLEGLIHVSNLAHRRVEKASELVAPGQEVEVLILEIKDGGKRIGLGLKQLQEDPWDSVEQRFPVEGMFKGRVTRLMDFGAFVELEPGIEGLLHVSQLTSSQLGGAQRVRHPKDVVKADEVVEVRVLSIDKAQRRISLSRLDSRGARLGSEDAADAGAIDALLRQSSNQPAGATNLGKLFQKALKGKP